MSAKRDYYDVLGIDISSVMRHLMARQEREAPEHMDTADRVEEHIRTVIRMAPSMSIILKAEIWETWMIS